MINKKLFKISWSEWLTHGGGLRDKIVRESFFSTNRGFHEEDIAIIKKLSINQTHNFYDGGGHYNEISVFRMR